MSNKTEVKPPHTERIFVTAEMARRWLRSNIENNRHINGDRVAQYVRDIKAGRWTENGETIKFAQTGELIDGQHRLTACVEAGIGFMTLVAYGVPKEAFVTIDRNQPRSIGQQLRLTHGITDHTNVQGALSWLARFIDGIVIERLRPTATEIEALLDENPGICDSVRNARDIQYHLKTPSASALAFAHYCFTRQDATLAEVFFAELKTGANLRTVDPAYRLRERIISSSALAIRRISTYEFLALLFKAWIAVKEGRTIEAGLKWQVGESFPNIGPIGKNKHRPGAFAVPVKEAPVKKFGKAGLPAGKGNSPSGKVGKALRMESKLEKLARNPLSLDRVQ